MDFRLWVVCDVDDGVSCRPLGYTCCRVSLGFWNERPPCGDVFALMFSTNSDTPPSSSRFVDIIRSCLEAQCRG